MESAFAPRPRSRLTDLRKLDDHLLRDIGLTRADVERLAGQEPPRDPLETIRMRI